MAIVYAIFYEEDTGQITLAGEMDDVSASANVVSGLSLIELSADVFIKPTPQTHYVDLSAVEVVEKIDTSTLINFSSTVVSANATSTIIVSGIPVSSLVVIELPIGATGTLSARAIVPQTSQIVNDGNITFKTDLPGDYKIIFNTPLIYTNYSVGVSAI